jgi:hypothetical protein
VVDICKGFKTPILMRHGRPGEEGLALPIYYTKPFSGDRTLDLVAATPDVRGKNCFQKLAYHGFAEHCCVCARYVGAVSAASAGLTTRQGLTLKPC